MSPILKLIPAMRPPDHIPPLDRSCNSWVVSRRETGEVIGEFCNRKNVEQFNPATCLIETALQYLGRINQQMPPPVFTVGQRVKVRLTAFTTPRRSKIERIELRKKHGQDQHGHWWGYWLQDGGLLAGDEMEAD